VLSVGEDFVILACVVFTQYQRVTDGRTDRQTDILIVAIVQGLQLPLTPCKKMHNQRAAFSAIVEFLVLLVLVE